MSYSSYKFRGEQMDQPPETYNFSGESQLGGAEAAAPAAGGAAGGAAMAHPGAAAASIGGSFLIAYMQKKAQEEAAKKAAQLQAANQYGENQNQALGGLNNTWRSALLK